MIRRYPSLCATAAIALAVTLTGCLAVDPVPFDMFHVATERVREGADAVMATEVEWTRVGFFEDAAESPEKAKAAFKRLKLEQDEDGADPLKYAVAQPPLLHVTLRETAKHLYRLNGVFVKYAAILRKLSGGEVINQEVFDRLAKDLEGHLGDAVKAAKEADLQMPSDTDTGIAFFSTAASEAFRTYIEHKRRAALRKALDLAQESVELWSQLGAAAARSAADGLWAEYTTQRDRIGTRFADEQNLGKKRAILEAYAKLGDDMPTALDTLSALKAAYVALPKAHADLAESLGDDRVTLDKLRAYYDHARHLQALYKELEKGE